MKTGKEFILLLVMALFITSCVKDEVYKGPPVISPPVIEPVSPVENQPVVIKVKVTDVSRLVSVKLFYRTSDQGNYISQVMSFADDTYSGTIPGQPTGTTVFYYIQAENEYKLKAYYPAGAPSQTAAFTIGAPLIVMNEIYSRGNVDNPDWIELYNDSDTEVSLTGYRIYDNGGLSGTKPKLQFPADAKIPPKGFYVIVVDNGTEAGFGLSSSGEEVWLENASGNVIDNVVFPAMSPSQSFGRLPDGSANWQLLNIITRGYSNVPPQPVIIVLINEIFSRGTQENPDWIELYNAGDNPATIGGFKIYNIDGQSGTKPKKELPAGLVLPAKSWLKIVVDDASASGFDLSPAGETIWLENSAGVVIDSILFPALNATQSFGRFPDGTSNLIVMQIPTPGTANTNASPPPEDVPVMNEIYSRGTTENPDWIEIYNPRNNSLSLAGYKIYDEGGYTGSKPKKEFPADAVVPAKGWYVIVVDDGEPSGFGLSSTGETVWLENPEGQIIDSIQFPALGITQSYGRYPDGSSSWQVLYVVTRGAANDNTIPPPPAGNLTMNEVYSRGTPENPDWIEIYNSTDEDINLTGYKIYDNGGYSGSKPKKEFPAGAIIPAKGFYVIVVDDGTPSGFGLSSNGEEIWLENPSGTVIDNFIFPAMALPTYSYGRKPDGTANFFIFIEITRGYSNNNAATLP